MYINLTLLNAREIIYMHLNTFEIIHKYLKY